MNKKKSIFQLLTEKPWEKDQIEADNKHQGQTVNLSKHKLGLRTIMAASTVLFSLFIVAYSDRMLISDWKNMPEQKLNSTITRGSAAWEPLLSQTTQFHWQVNRLANILDYFCPKYKWHFYPYFPWVRCELDRSVL